MPVILVDDEQLSNGGSTDCQHNWALIARSTYFSTANSSSEEEGDATVEENSDLRRCNINIERVIEKTLVTSFQASAGLTILFNRIDILSRY